MPGRKQRWFDVRVTRFEGDEQARVVVSHENITERKLAELSLLEKQKHIEMLNARLRRSMTETHHRVKNNLQIVAALLDMQMMEHSRAVPTSELKQLAMHIHVLSLVHDPMPTSL